MNGNKKVIKNKLGLLNLAAELGNIKKACQIMGYSRDSYYRYKELMEEGGADNLIDRTRRVPNLKNRVSAEMEEAVCKFAVAYPAYGQVRVSNELKKTGLEISPGGVRCVWLRAGLANFKSRLKALEKKVAEEGIILTEAQIVALERKREVEEWSGEIETEHPGYLGSQDTFYVGHMKGVGRIYQQTFVDTYSKMAFCKLYNAKTPITAADLLNDKVLPFFEDHGQVLMRILTDRGTEYCGNLESHAYQLFLDIHDISHTKTKARHPQTNGICERFHKSILQEFYQVAFRKKIYTNIEGLQEDLDIWLHDYNTQRTHQGKMCCGRTPLETFKAGQSISKEKDLNNLVLSEATSS